uniref:SET domain-containing protein n=1 Tax=Sinocyclocheilus rhinocerous TaxID=307959 RepID=A0A673M1P9_9TELE
HCCPGICNFSGQPVYNLLVKTSHSVETLLKVSEVEGIFGSHMHNTFGPRQPSESKVHSWIEKQGWMENVPDAAEVVKDWKPPRSIQAPADSKSIRRMSRRQCWKGLQLMDREGKGLRVVTSRPFACGEVICDFHGRLISRDEGLEIQQNNQTQAGHLFFFTSKNGQDMCLEAHEERCECHPNKTTFGRQMKHSARRANLSPRLHFVDDEPLIVFMATRDIQTGEELRYDYGDNRRSCALIICPWLNFTIV